MDTSNTVHLSEPRILNSEREASAFTRLRKLSAIEHVENLLRRFSPAQRLLLYVFSILLGLSTIGILMLLNNAISTEIPTRGGSFVEGTTGPARFINPVLAISDPDEDLTQLIYSGLLRVLPEGSYVPDLAESYTISPDGRVYTFRLRSGLTFHDGTPVTANDVVYTVGLAQNPDIKSPHRADWEGVQVTSPDPLTVVFTLPQAYAPFIEDTTLGILPKHLWQNVEADSFPFSPLNTHPVGTGPYKVASVKTDAAGAPTRYDLVPFDNFALHGAYIGRISFAFYPNQEALARAFAARQVDAIAGVTPSELKNFKREDTTVIVSPLPRVFGIFFNQNHNAVLADSSVRQALEESLDKQAIVNQALHSYGSVLDSPIPPGVLGFTKPAVTEASGGSVIATTSKPVSPEIAANTLKRAGWIMSSSTGLWTKNIPKSGTTPASKQELTFKLATADEPELLATANLVAAQWKVLGVNVDIQVYPLSDFNNAVLRPRNYDAILFGEVVSRSADLFAFWHSSQRNDPGLNLSLYANSKADALLAKARTSISKEERDSLYSQFISIVQKDRPAIFLYSPDFIYIVPTKIQDIQIGALSSAAERFLNVYHWYADTEHVWNFFVQDNQSISN